MDSATRYSILAYLIVLLIWATWGNLMRMKLNTILFIIAVICLILAFVVAREKLHIWR